MTNAEKYWKNQRTRRIINKVTFPVHLPRLSTNITPYHHVARKRREGSCLIMSTSTSNNKQRNDVGDMCTICKIIIINETDSGASCCWQSSVCNSIRSWGYLRPPQNSWHRQSIFEVQNSPFVHDWSKCSHCSGKIQLVRLTQVWRHCLWQPRTNTLILFRANSSIYSIVPT